MSLGHYAVLKVARDASGEEIRKSYRRLSQEWHLRQGASAGADRSEIDAINAAYKTLSNEEARRAYDQEIAANGGKEPQTAPAASEPAKSQASGKGKWAIGAGLAAAAVVAAWVFGAGSEAPTASPAPSTGSSAPSQAAPSAADLRTEVQEGLEAQSPELLAASLAGDKRREEERAEAAQKAKEDAHREEKAKEDKLKEEKALAEKAKEDKARELGLQERREEMARETGSRQSQLAARAPAAHPPTPLPTLAPMPALMPAPMPSPNPTAAKAPSALDARAACPRQVVPEMPKLLTDSSGRPLPQADVRARVTIQGGSVREVKIVSGPRVYHAAVISAVRRYGCVDTAEPATFLQEFSFKPAQQD